MIEQATTWSYVDTAMYVRGEDGSTWRVEQRWLNYAEPAERFHGFRLVNRAGQYVDICKGGDDPAIVLVPTTEEAINVVRQILGLHPANVFKIEEMPTKNTPTARAMLAGHLLHHHHIPAFAHRKDDVANMAELVEAHNLAHARPQPGSIPHIHV